MKNKYFPAVVIIVGMVLSHLFFTVMVYQSNRHLHQNILQVIHAGYLPVPNKHILPGLEQVGTALKGAFFYTLTAGIVLPFLVYLAAWAWDRGYRRKRPFLIILSGFVIFCMVMLNRHGFNPIVTFWFITVYIAVFKLTLYSLDGVETHLSAKRLVTHLIVLAVLGAAWMTVPKGTNFFLSVRDHLLLSNSIGERITNFYYRYSPYPTHAYKSLKQKQIKTCVIDGDVTDSLMSRLETVLLRYDYLPIDSDADPDMVIRVYNDALSFSVSKKIVLKTAVDGFLQSPSAVLEGVSSRCDRNEFTRRLLAFSLIFGLPIFLYACLSGILQLVFSRISSRSTAFSASVGGSLAIGIVALILFKTIAPASVPVSQISSTLESDDADARVAALRSISNEGLDPAAYMSDAFSNIGSYVPERIWWAISLANSPERKADETLLQLLDDPNPLVRCKAYDSLAKRGYRQAIPTIIEKLGTSRSWYVQAYAYGALRSLGWKQKASS